MHHLNDSDLNAEGTFPTRSGRVDGFPVHLRGYADSVEVLEMSTSGSAGLHNELVVEFMAEAGQTGACVRLRDLLKLALQHYPDLVAEVQGELEGTGAATAASAAPETNLGYGGYGNPR